MGIIKKVKIPVNSFTDLENKIEDWPEKTLGSGLAYVNSSGEPYAGNDEVTGWYVIQQNLKTNIADYDAIIFYDSYSFKKDAYDQDRKIYIYSTNEPKDIDLIGFDNDLATYNNEINFRTHAIDLGSHSNLTLSYIYDKIKDNSYYQLEADKGLTYILTYTDSNGGYAIDTDKFSSTYIGPRNRYAYWQT